MMLLHLRPQQQRVKLTSENAPTLRPSPAQMAQFKNMQKVRKLVMHTFLQMFEFKPVLRDQQEL
jgi:hypothetical protein